MNLSVLATQVFLDTYATNGINGALAREATSAYAREVFETRLRDASVLVVVAEVGEHLVGFVDLAFATQCPTPGVVGAEVFRLYVQRPFLRRGIGRRLMQFVEHEVQARNLPSLWLTAWAGNANALAFYKASGYEDVGTTEYVIEGKGHENRVLHKRFAVGA